MYIPAAAAALVVLGAAGWLIRKYIRSRVTPEERERLRRDAINRAGKMGDGEIIDVVGDSLVYSWYVAGVNYTASQDVTALLSQLPEDRMSVVGPASVKFLPRNPANSIVVSENWSGLRSRA